MATNTLLVMTDKYVVGRLWMGDDDRLKFAYDPDWQRNPRFLLSQSLPLSDSVYSGRPVESFFGGLLPEGDLRTAIEKVFQITRGNDFGLLAALGGDCAGAISLLPPNTAPGPASSASPLDDAALVELIENLEQRPLGMTAGGIRISMAGAQQKLVLVHEDNKWLRPTMEKPSNCLLKPPIKNSGIADSVENEQFCMTLARNLDLPVPDCWALELTNCYVVERYDRHRNNRGVIKRIHQEDFCQALGLPSQKKYEYEGGPGLAACFALVRKASRLSTDRLHLLRWVIFNVVIGNNDAHGKNLSLLYDQIGSFKPKLAPFYDLMSTAIYKELSPDMAMAIGGKRDFRYMSWRHWLDFAEECGLGKPLVTREIRSFSVQIVQKAEILLLDDAFAGQPTVSRIVDLIKRRGSRLQSMYDAHRQAAKDADSTDDGDPIQ